MKIAEFAPFTLAFATLAVAACNNQQQPTAKPSPTMAHEAATPSAPAQGISVSDGRLVLPAVHGNPGAVYFTVHNGTGGKVTLNGARVEGAGMAMMHQTVMENGQASMEELAQGDVPADGDLVFAPGGRHVMAMNLDDKLKPGGTTQVTLTFTNGGEATFPAEILAAGNAH